MGWAETPQWQWLDGTDLPIAKYSKPVYGASKNGVEELTLPYDTENDYMAFCGGSGQACNPSNTANPCPNTDSTCWWHGNVGWAYCPDDCATEHLAYSLGSSEPATDRIYPKDCDVLKAPSGRSLAVVDDLTNQANNLLGCSGGTQGGKFVLRTGSPTGDLPTVSFEDNSVSYAYRYAYYAQIDLHQVGVGYQGHMWFTHSYPSSLANYHKVVGQWTPDLPSGTAKYDVLVHLPSHGGAVTNADYILYGSAGAQTTSGECVLSQDTNGVDKWAYLGTWSLQPGARVLLSNIISGGNGSTDISYDALAFMSASGTTTHACGSAYSS
jgi:hypothetical protein